MYPSELPGRPGLRGEHAGLAVRAPSQRLAALIAENRRLLREVMIRRKQLARLQAEIRERGGQAAARLEPLSDRLRALDAEIHALFADLLTSRRLTRVARRLVQGFYERLQAQEVLSSSAERAEAEADLDADLDEASSEHGDPVRPAPGSGARPTAAEGPLRELFLRLARALHPDRAREAPDAESRTDAMKEVNSAYRRRDLARLLEIERLWLETETSSDARPGPATASDQREAELKELNSALRAQHRELQRQYRQLKRSDLGKLVSDLKRGRAELEDIVSGGEMELARLTRLRDNIRSFGEGQLSLQDLLLRSEHSDEDLFAEGSAVPQGQPPAAPGRKRQRHKR